MTPALRIDRPLAVDLDGTLVHTNCLVEGMLSMVRHNVFSIFQMLVWLLRGKAVLKAKVHERIRINAECLPYNLPLLEWLREERSRGRKLILVTGADQSVADAVAAHLGLFHQVLASDGSRNLTGRTKGVALEAEFGKGQFDYAADSSVDWHIWRSGAGAVLVNASPNFAKKLRRAGHDPVAVWPRPRFKLRDLIRALRPHQWVKNLLICVPLITSHRLFEFSLLAEIALAFVAFSLCASAIYILNDLLDLPFDRLHPSKRNRPIAAGKVRLGAALTVAAGCLTGAFAIAMLKPLLWLMLLLYALVSISYSMGLKRQPMLDILILAGLYTMRMYTGGVVTGIPISPWLLAFSIFTFLSLALVKRYRELIVVKDAARQGGRGYLPNDAVLLLPYGIAMGGAAAIVLSLYINSADVTLLYFHPQMLWGLVPIYLYWITRVWLLTNRNEMNDDPVVFTLRDKATYVMAAIGGLLLSVAKRDFSFWVP